MIILDLIDEFELGPNSLSDSIIIIVLFWHTVEPFIFMTLVSVWYLRMMKVSLPFVTHVSVLYFVLEVTHVSLLYFVVEH
jgi:hypothetical protein